MWVAFFERQQLRSMSFQNVGQPRAKRGLALEIDDQIGEISKNLSGSMAKMHLAEQLMLPDGRKQTRLRAEPFENEFEFPAVLAPGRRYTLIDFVLSLQLPRVKATILQLIHNFLEGDKRFLGDQ